MLQPRVPNRHFVRVKQNVVSRLLPVVLSVALLFAATLNLSAQGTAISYQGQLSVAGSPANTNYDFRFAVYDAVTNGNRVSDWLTNSAVPVANGLFSVTLDFSTNVFNSTDNGSNDWMDVGVRAAGGGTFTVLTPRQPILPVPYALFATSASNLLGSLAATQIIGSLPSSVLSGAYSNVVNFVNGSNSFAGNGAGLTNLNASSLASGTVADVRLSSNVALLNQAQTFTGNNTLTGSNLFTGSDLFTGTNKFIGPATFTGTNTFTASNTFTGPGYYTGVNAFTNFGNSFVGSFYGNGLVGWQVVSSASQQAARDNGYMLTSVGFTTVTLPSSPLNSVDIVRISGAGPGGWRAMANSGQFIIGNFASYSNCFPVEVENGSFTGIAASADGVHMFAVGATSFTGVYASADSGETWSLIPAVNLTGYFLSVACSANGRIVYAEPAGIGSHIMASGDGGTTWGAINATATGNAIACTADGTTKLFTSDYACSGNGTYLAKLTGTTISFSTNAGSTWFALPNAPANISCVAASSDCTRLVAGVTNATGGLLYASADLGSTWSALTVTNQIWSGAWMSPDGTKLAASATTSGVIGGGLFYATVIPQPNTIATNVVGSQGSAVELQYIGNNQFMPVSSTGMLWAN